MPPDLIPAGEISAQDIMLIQPNNVTFGQYHITEWQENLLTLISDKLQKHMTREQELPRDLFNQPYVTVICDEAGGKNNKSKVLKEAVDLLHKKFSFRWTHPKMNKEIETIGGSVITTIHNVKGTNQIMINLNPWAIPFLIYYGVGVGGTRFSKGLALSLRGNYTKRLYKIVCSQRDRKEYYYPILQLKKDLEIPDNHTNYDIDRKILKPSQQRIKESGADVWFEYEMITKYKVKGRKPKADTIIFRIKTQHPKDAGGTQAQEYYFVYRWIKEAMGNPTNDSALQAVEKITAMGRLKEVYERCAYYDDQVSSGERTTEHAKNSLLKMIREEFKIGKELKKSKKLKK